MIFLVFLGLSVIIHETFHLVVARALGYSADIFYGMSFFNLYGYVRIDPPPQHPLHTVIMFSAGGLGTAAVFFVLWSAIEDIVAKLLLSFFTSMQLTYGLLETLYGLGIIKLEVLGLWPILVGIATMLVFRVIYWRLGWW
ncbi:MAG: hypothetical protein ACP5PX_04465 [Candidatus Hadarchaeum sp.]|uniref:hypothetical protein n=1 Tax=Candidatus Hadarchaeum sp. TaxID=2883567 RepID=UPI003D0F7AB0